MVGQIELEDYLKSINRESLNILDYIPTGRMNAITRHQKRIVQSMIILGRVCMLDLQQHRTAATKSVWMIFTQILYFNVICDGV